jgi:integrase
MAKRLHNEGTYFDRVINGKKYFVHQFHYINEQGLRKRKAIYSTLQDELAAKKSTFLDKQEKLNNPIETLPGDDMTIAQFIDAEWFPFLKDQVSTGVYKRRSVENYISIAENHIKPAFGHFMLNTIRAKDIINGYRALKKEQVTDPKTGELVRKTSDNTIHDIQRRFSVLFQYAIEQEYVTDNPTIAVRNNRVLRGGVKKEMKILADEQYHRVLEFLQEPYIISKNTGYRLSNPWSHYYPVIHTLLHTGARRNEILGLRWKDVDLTLCIATIRQQVDILPGGIIELTPLKTESSYREVALTYENAQILQEYFDAQSYPELDSNGQIIEGRTITPQPEDLIFRRLDAAYGELGSFIQPAVLTHAWIKIMKHLGFELGSSLYARLHDIRHTHASVLYDKGADDLEVSRRLGHSNTSITQNIYTHLTANKKRETANKVGDALKKV